MIWLWPAPIVALVMTGTVVLHADPRTSAGPRWNDFEDVCLGSPAWDVVGLLDDAREHHGEAFAADLLAAYGRDVDRTLAPLVRDAHALYGKLWRRYREAIAGAEA